MVEVGCWSCSLLPCWFLGRFSSAQGPGSYQELQRVGQRVKGEARGSGSDSEHEDLHGGEEETVKGVGRRQQNGWRIMYVGEREEVL